MWTQENRDIWLKANKEKKRQCNRQWHKKNRIKSCEATKKWRKAHPECGRKWLASPRGKVVTSLICAKRRCQNPKHKDFKYYGGRGIKYLLDDCREEAIAKLLPGFTMLMFFGVRPSIDRIDGNGHYSLGNIQALSLTLNSRKP